METGLLVRPVGHASRIFTGIAVAGAATAVVFWWSRPAAEVPHQDLLSLVGHCRKQPSDASFEVREVAIDGETRQAIVATGPTRLTCHVTVPERAWFSVALALMPEVWALPGDGVRFSIGVADGRSFHDKHVAHIDPAGQAADRRWHDVSLDLREYRGMTIDIVLNTRAGPSPQSTPDHDRAVWGAPRIVIR